MFKSALQKDVFKQTIAYFAWFCLLMSTCLPAPVLSDLSVSVDENNETRNKAAYVVAGLTVIGIAAGIAFLSTASGHHKHHVRSSAMSSVDNYRPYSYDYHSHHHSDYSSDYSDDYSYHSSDHHSSHHRHNHHHSGYYSSNPYSIFSENDVSSFSGGSDRNQRDKMIPRAKTSQAAGCLTKNEEDSLVAGQFIAAGSVEGHFTAFVQLPDGTSRSLGTISNGYGSIPYGPFDQKGTYTFGVTLDQENASSSQLKICSVEVALNGSTVQRHEFSVPPHAPRNYEPSPCCFNLSQQ